MNKRVYLPGDVVYHEGSNADFFFLIKTGKVWFIQSSFDDDIFPFMEIDSNFGAWEAVNQMRRGWTAIAKVKTVLFSIHIRDFEKIFKETIYYKPFLEV